MRNAQEQALLALASGRGLLAAEQRARLEGSASTGSGEHLAQRLIQERLLPPQALAGLLRELAGGAWRCAGCQVRLGWPQLSQLPGLRCRCGGELVSLGSGASSSAVGRLQHSQATVAGPPPGGRASAVARSSALGQADTRAGTHPAHPTSGLGQARALPRRLGAFTLEKQLGRGSCATVYLGRRDGVAREFAVKVVDDPDPDDEELLARFRREVDVASRIRHPGVIPVFEAGEEGGSHYYVMDYCPGVTLKERLKSGGPLPPAEAAALVASLARAIEAAHAAGVIHRDLKPANIIIEDGTHQPRITDFGMARDERHLRQLTDTGDVLGTPYYMAPEQFRGERDLDRRIDVYALGVILYEALTGRRPYDGPTALALKRRVEQGDPVPPSQLVPEVPAELEEVCLRAMAVEPDERPGSAADLADELEELAAPPAPPAAVGTGRLLAVAVGGVLFGLVVAGGAVALVLSRGGLAPPPPPPPPPVSARPDPAEQVDGLLQHAIALVDSHARGGHPLPWVDVEEAFRAADGASGEPGALRDRVNLVRAGHDLRRGRWAEALQRAQGQSSDLALLICARAQEKLARRGDALQLYGDVIERAKGRAAAAVGAAALARLQGQKPRPADLAGLVSTDGVEDALWLELARARLAARELDAAVQALDRLVQLRADDPEEALVRARVHVAKRSYREARKELDRSAALCGGVDDADRLAVAAEVAMQERRFGDAQELLRRALTADPAHVEALVHRAVIGTAEESRHYWQQAGAISRAARLAVASEHWAEYLPVLRQLGSFDIEKGSQSSRAWIEDVSQRAPEAAREPISRALKASVLGARWDEVARLCSATLAVSSTPQMRREVARLCLGRGLASEALIHLEEVPEDAERERMRGEAHWFQGFPGKALESFQRAAALEPQGVEGRCASAAALWLERREAEALTQLDQALAREPEHFGCLFLRALTLASLRRDDEAVGTVEAAQEQRGFMDVRTLSIARGMALEDDASTNPLQALQALFTGTAAASDQNQVWMRCNFPHMWFLARDLIFRRRNETTRLKPPATGWNQDAYFHLVMGRNELLRTKDPGTVRSHWREALRIDPLLRFPEADRRDLRERLRVELEALLR